VMAVSSACSTSSMSDTHRKPAHAN
jgi:hypothetical protein